MRSSSSHELKTFLSNEPSFTLLRSHSAHLVISFLYTQFRKQIVQTISCDELENNFAVFLKEHEDEEEKLANDFTKEDDALQELKESTNLAFRAKKYIQSWCNEDKGYIRRYYNQNNVLVVELTPSIERLFTFLDDAEPKTFVGTESRFKTILYQLRELNQNINENPEIRISRLNEQKKKITDEIKSIQVTGKVETYTHVQIQERLDEIIHNSRSLLGEFRQVEENFRDILQEIYKKQSELETTKGTILGYTLDTDSKMRDSAQGQSFSSFWNFIAQDTDNEIATLVREIINSIENDASKNLLLKNDSTDFLLALKRNLYNAGNKIIEQNRSLSEKLNRVLKQQSQAERQQAKVLTSEVKQLMHAYTKKFGDKKTAISDECMWLQNLKPKMFFPQSRKAITPEKNSSFNEIHSFNQEDVQVLDIQELFTQFYVDEKELLNHLKEFKQQKNNEQFTLKELLEVFPLQKGLSELVAWYGIANKQDGILITQETQDIITYQKDDKTIMVKVPRMIFL